MRVSRLVSASQARFEGFIFGCRAPCGRRERPLRWSSGRWSVVPWNVGVMQQFGSTIVGRVAKEFCPGAFGPIGGLKAGHFSSAISNCQTTTNMRGLKCETSMVVVIQFFGGPKDLKVLLFNEDAFGRAMHVRVLRRCMSEAYMAICSCVVAVVGGTALLLFYCVAAAAAAAMLPEPWCWQAREVRHGWRGSDPDGR